MNSGKMNGFLKQCLISAIVVVLLCSEVESRFNSKSMNDLGFGLGKKKSDGKCSSAERCCVGRDSSCAVHGYESTTSCYCDEGCLETGDCCSDYQEVCNVQGKSIVNYIEVT